MPRIYLHPAFYLAIQIALDQATGRKFFTSALPNPLPENPFSCRRISPLLLLILLLLLINIY